LLWQEQQEVYRSSGNRSVAVAGAAAAGVREE